MIAHLEMKSWHVGVHSYRVWGTTGDGWQLEYAIRESGQCSLSVYSELFWTND